MRKGDPQGPTRRGEPLEGRWCGARVVPAGLYAWSEEELIPCGGELLYRRRREAGQIVSYLVCQFCGAKTPMLACDGETMQHTDLTPEPAVVTLSRRECYFCRRLKRPEELEYRSLRAPVRGVALCCRGGCAPQETE